MERYVEFIIKNRSKYIKVTDFNKETIRSLPQYKEEWSAFYCWEGTPNYINDQIVEISPGKVKLSVHYGKRIPFSKVYEIIGNDLKYKEVLKSMKNMAQDAFWEEYCHADYWEYRDKEEEFSENFNHTHSCLFVMPDVFNAKELNRENSMTVEEFDSSIVLNYEDTLHNIALNAKCGKEYYEKHQQLLKIFHEYFSMICAASKHFIGNDYEALFSIINFNFYGFSMFTSIEDINLFLKVYEYVYEQSDYFDKDKFSLFKDYVKKRYSEGLSRN